MALLIKGIDRLKAQLTDQAKSCLPGAILRALDKTLYGAQMYARAEARDSFDRPVPATIMGIRSERTGPTSGRVYIDDGTKSPFDVSAVLAPHIHGGERGIKGIEKHLRRMGVLGQGQYVIPGTAAKRDAYGNISYGQMTKIVSAAKLMWDERSNQRKGKRGYNAGVYVIPFKGVFWRPPHAGVSYPLLHFTYAVPQYEKRFDFYYAVSFYFKKYFSANLAEALSKTRRVITKKAA